MKIYMIVITVLIIPVLGAISVEIDEGNYIVIGDNPPLRYFDIVELKYGEQPDLTDLGIPDKFQIQPEEAFIMVQDYWTQPEPRPEINGELTGEYYLSYNFINGSWDYVFLSKQFYSYADNFGLKFLPDSGMDLEEFAERFKEYWEENPEYIEDIITASINDGRKIKIKRKFPSEDWFKNSGSRNFRKIVIPADKRSRYTIHHQCSFELPLTLEYRVLEESMAKSLLGDPDANCNIVGHTSPEGTITCFRSKDNEVYITIAPFRSAYIIGENAFNNEMDSNGKRVRDDSSEAQGKNKILWDVYIELGIPDRGEEIKRHKDRYWKDEGSEFSNEP